MRFLKASAILAIASLLGQPAYADRTGGTPRSATQVQQNEYLAGSGTIVIVLLIAAVVAVAALASGNNHHMPASP
jgi:hypothetical protein